MPKRGIEESGESVRDDKEGKRIRAAGSLLDHDVVTVEDYWTMTRAVAWHYTVELEKFARQIDDPQLTEAINAIIRELQPGALRMMPEEIFQQVKDAIVSTTKSRTTNRNVGLLLGAVSVASTVYNQYLKHIAQIEADASYLCQFAGLLCKETPTFTQWALASMPMFEQTSEIAMSLLAIALFSIRLRAKYDAATSLVSNAIDLTKTIFGYSLVEKKEEVAAAEPGGAAAAAAAAEDHSTQEGLQGIDMGDIAAINNLLANLKEGLADPALEDDMLGGRRRRRRQTRRRKSLLRKSRCHKAKRRTKKRSCCSKRRRKTCRRHRKNRRRHHQTRR